MALKHFDPAISAAALDELTLWREATTVYLASGHGGCGPFGLANALARRGLAAEVRLFPDEPLFLQSVRDPEKRKVLTLVQEGYRAEAEKLQVARSDQPLDAVAIAAEVAGGRLAIVLISGYRMFGKKRCPIGSWFTTRTSGI
ncbi:peptidase C39 family protein [Roseibium salinum]|nr:peptidase C39 family protein [Roseibium salinum]